METVETKATSEGQQQINSGPGIARVRETCGIVLSHPLLAPEEWKRAVSRAWCWMFKEENSLAYWFWSNKACKSHWEAVVIKISEENSSKKVTAWFSSGNTRSCKSSERSWDASKRTLLQEPKKAAAAPVERDECNPNPSKWNGREAYLAPILVGIWLCSVGSVVLVL